MRKLMWIAVIVGLGALSVGAAEQPAPGDQPGKADAGGRQGGGRGGRGGGMRGGPNGGVPGGPGGGMRGGFGGRMFGAVGGMFDALTGIDVFDAARKTLDLSDQAKAGVEMLDTQFTEQLQAGITELRMKLSKDYVAKVLDLLPADQKPKYEAVAKALNERDEAVAAAQKELTTALDKVRTSQGADKVERKDVRPRFGQPGGSTTSKVEVLRTHFVLTEKQQGEIDIAQRENFGLARDRMQAIFAGMRDAGGQRDPNAFRRVGQSMRQIRDEVDDQVAKIAVEFLTDEQKKDYATACTAIDTCRTKMKEAEDVCRKKIVGAVGEEKANALLGLPPGKLAEPKKGTGF